MRSPQEIIVDLVQIDYSKLNLDDPDAKGLLDELAVAAKTYAKAQIAAERGTHTHELTEDRDEGRDPIERMRSGEQLGLDQPVQTALIEVWDLMQSEDYFEIIEVEAKCVDDRWRLAGTLDRIVRLKRDITFYCYGGEVVTLKAGTVLILDIKTGQLRLTPKGEPLYWHGYAIQIASYAQSVPFDPDTGTRGVWPFEIDQKWAIIAHLDVLGAVAGEAVCRLILVDIEAGRAAGDLVVAAKAWEKRKDVFSIIGASPDEVMFTVPVEYPEEAPPSVPVFPSIDIPPPTVPPGITTELPGQIVDYSEQHTEDLNELAQQIAGFPETVRVKLARTWPDPTVLPYPSQVRDGEAAWTANQLPLLQTLLSEASAPFGPWDNRPDAPQPRDRAFITAPPPHSDLSPVEMPTLKVLTDAVRVSVHVERINRWLTEGHTAGVPFSPLAMPNVGNYERLRTALRLAEFAEDDVDIARVLLDYSPFTSIGEVVGRLTSAEAQAVYERIEALDTGRSLLLYTDDGTPRIVDSISA